MIRYALDAILVSVLVEGIALATYYAKTGSGLPPVALASNLGAGFFLMLAARIATGSGEIAGGTQALVATCLLVALVAHIADLAGRWRG